MRPTAKSSWQVQPRRHRAFAALALGLTSTLASACRRSPPSSEKTQGAEEPLARDASDGTEPDAGDDAPRLARPTGEGVPLTASYGTARTSRMSCRGLAGPHVAERDLTTSFVDGDDPLALVNRSPTGVLPPDYAPRDLVDWRNGKALSAAECEKYQCLRKDAAEALRELLAAMKREGFPGKVESAFRSYGAQCGTFLRWAAKGSFCDATEQSALPGHSQHQLGTTVDLFTEAWAADPRGVFRDGFGCTPAGTWLREQGFRFGFVLPYPLHPDDRHEKRSCLSRVDRPVFINPKTGYRFEHWHLRWIGKEAARRFEEARASSAGADGRTSPDELTLEQWIRREKGFHGPDADLPVCDGCNCGACATLAERSTCDGKGAAGGAIHLDAEGKPRAASGSPRIVAAHLRGVTRDGVTRVLEVEVEGAEDTLTQPPVVGPGIASYAAGGDWTSIAPYPKTLPRAFPPLAEAWTIGASPVPSTSSLAFPWRAAIAAPTLAQIHDKANVLLPAARGRLVLRLEVPGDTERVSVALLHGGVPEGPALTIDP